MIKSKMLKITISIFVFLVNSLFVFSQPPNIIIDNNEDNDPVEPSIIISRKNTNNLLAGSNLDNCYLSNDGGLTWTSFYLSSNSGVWGDPSLNVDTTGNFYFFHLSNPETGHFIDRIVCQKIEDGTPTIDSYMGLNGDKYQDKAWSIVNYNTDEIYVTWTQFDKLGSSEKKDSSVILFSKSLDAGANWSTPKRINKFIGNCMDNDSTAEGAVPAIGVNDEIFVAWALNDKIYFNKSTDDGDSWLEEETVVCGQVGGWAYDIPGISRCNGLPITCTDLSKGPHRGTIYINFSDQRNGKDDTDIWLVKSTDNGNSWSSPIRVNDDTTQTHQFLTWMTIDQVTGYVYIVFYDRRDYTDNNTDVYMAMSKDGGETFKNIKISESPFKPNSSIFFGDYTNVSAHNNVIRPIWTRLNDNKLSVLTAIVDVDDFGTDVISFQKEKNITSNEIIVNPNPFKEKTFVSFKMHKESHVKIVLRDIYGRKIKILKNQKLKAGKYIQEISASENNLQNGIYFVQIIINRNKIITKKIVFNN